MSPENVLRETGTVKRIPLIFHERSGRWVAGLKARLPTDRIHLVETRSRQALLEAATSGSPSIVLIEVWDDPEPALRDLAALTAVGEAPLVLLLGHGVGPDVRDLAYELGASFAASDPLPRPEAADLLSRWIALESRRASQEGWVAPTRVARFKGSLTIEELLEAMHAPADER